MYSTFYSQYSLLSVDWNLASSFPTLSFLCCWTCTRGAKAEIESGGLVPHYSIPSLISISFESNIPQLVPLRPLPPNSLPRLEGHPLGPPNTRKNSTGQILRPSLHSRTPPTQPQPLRRISIRRPAPSRRHHQPHPNKAPHPHDPINRSRHPQIRIQTSHHRRHLLRPRHAHHNRHIKRLPQHPRNLHQTHNPQHQTLQRPHLPPPHRHLRPPPPSQQHRPHHPRRLPS